MRNKSILHIFTTESTYQISFIQFVEKHFPSANHIFVFRSRKISKNQYKAGTKVISKPNFFSLILFLPKLVKSKQVILHYLPYGPSLPFWALYSFFFKNVTWVFWGGDIYVYEDKTKNIRSRVYEICRKIIIKNINYIAGFLTEDFKLIENIYKPKASYKKSIYPLPTNFKLLDNYIQNAIHSPDNKTRILVGNSADPSNNHLEILNLLKRYIDCDIEIYCPLSYGASKVEITKIVQEGSKLFGEKFIPLLDLLPIEDYCRLLVSIDIAIMNHNRQQGLGNIISLLWLGKKVYVRSDTTSFTYFKSEGIIVSDTLHIKNLSFEEFVSLDPNDAFKNKSIVLNVFTNENYFKLWNNVFNLK